MCNTEQIQRGLRKIGWAIAAGFCIGGLAKPVLEVTAQEYNLTIGAGVEGGVELNWDHAGQNAKYTVEYATDLAKQQWAELPHSSAWPIDVTRFELPLVVGAETVFYRVKIEGADPHQVRWFATAISPNPQNKANGYPDPDLAVSFDDDAILVTSNGIPTFEFVSTTPNGLRGQDFEWAIPRFPEPADEPTQIPLLGTVAITTAGLPIYGPNEAQVPHPYGDPYINGILDYCHGHTGGQADYHFHFAPTCMFEAPDGTEEHYNIIGFALDGYPIIAHYTGVHGETGETAFGWLEVSGYEPDADYKSIVIDGSAISTYAWDNYEYEAGRKGRTLDECNGRALAKVTLANGKTFDEASFLGFDYGYFVTAEFPYFIAKYRGTAGTGGGGQPGGGGQLPGGGEGDDAVTAVTPDSGSPGDTLTVTVMLNGNAQPPLPPTQIQPTSVTVGDMSLTGMTRTSRTSIRGTLRIPANAAKGKKDVTVVFPGPPRQGDVRFAGDDLFEVK
ncbi:MAG: YHYH protein [Verrucomicrobia bacterium]|nr:YHYH protein [Verrucomicrobiota bacterium]